MGVGGCNYGSKILFIFSCLDERFALFLVGVLCFLFVLGVLVVLIVLVALRVLVIHAHVSVGWERVHT